MDEVALLAVGLGVGCWLVLRPRQALLAEAATLPFQAVLILQFGANIKVSELLGVAVVAGWMLTIVRRGAVDLGNYRRVVSPLALFLIVAVASLLGTVRHDAILRAVSLESVTGVVGGRQDPFMRGPVTAAWAVFSVLNMMATASLIRSTRYLMRLVRVMSVAGALAGAYAFYKLLFLNLPLPQLWFPGDIATGWARGWYITRSDGTFMEPATMANFFIVMIPLAFVVAMSERKKRWWLVLLAQMAGILSSVSPGGLVSFAVAFPVFLLLAARIRGWPMVFAVKSIGKVACGVAVLGVAAIWLLDADATGIALAFWDKMVGGTTNVDQAIATANASSWDARVALSRIALSMWRHNALTGVGIGNYPFLHQYYATLDHLGGAEGVTVTPSVLYLLLMAETGVIGLALFVVFGWRLFRRCLWAARCGETGAPAWVALGLTGSLLGIAVNGFFLDNPFANYYWVVAGLALATSRLTSVEREAPVPSPYPHARLQSSPILGTSS